ncbi:hypothetical protein FQN50_006693 [Emmonsiellopsis sp. PD_5]|nr:hypothetical protein FQN50_006693 [Emmonsiellopsis sp. PD_5]
MNSVEVPLQVRKRQMSLQQGEEDAKKRPLLHAQQLQQQQQQETINEIPTIPSPAPPPYQTQQQQQPKTGPYFFYSTLKDPSTLATVLDLPRLPKMRPARLTDYRVKYWGERPVLVHEPYHQVEGMVYQVRSEEEAGRLAEFQTERFWITRCRIQYLDGGGLDNVTAEEEVGSVFEWGLGTGLGELSDVVVGKREESIPELVMSG